jgi:hypothetical protein
MTGSLGAFATELTPEEQAKVEELKAEVRPHIKVGMASMT